MVKRSLASVYGTVLAAVLFVLCAVPLPAVHAQEGPLSCEFTDALAELNGLQADYYGDPAFRVRTELAIRKKILTTIIDCASADADLLEQKIKETPAEDTVIGPVRARFMETLTSARRYYAEARSRVDTLGIGGSKELAREVRAWRENTYTPTATQALNFLVWVKNQELFRAANGRLADVQAAIRSLKLTEDEKAQTLLGEAVTSLRDANSENDRVRMELDQFPPPPNTLGIIQRSLEKLAHTYEQFFALSELAQKLIPLGEKK